MHLPCDSCHIAKVRMKRERLEIGAVVKTQFGLKILGNADVENLFGEGAVIHIRA